MDPTARAHELIEVTESLTTLIDQENELLGELRVKEIGALQQEKNSLSGLYELRIREATQDDGVFDNIAPEIRARLPARLANRLGGQGGRQKMDGLLQSEASTFSPRRETSGLGLLAENETNKRDQHEHRVA